MVMSLVKRETRRPTSSRCEAGEVDAHQLREHAALQVAQDLHRQALGHDRLGPHAGRANHNDAIATTGTSAIFSRSPLWMLSVANLRIQPYEAAAAATMQPSTGAIASRSIL